MNESITQTTEPVIAPVIQPVVEPVVTAPETSATTITQQSYIDAEGNFTEGFEKILPEDVRGHSSVKKFKDIGSVFKSQIEAEKLIGKRVAEYLDSDNPAVKAELAKRNGVPESPDKYKIDIKLPEGYEMGTEGIAKFREMAHKIGLPEKFAAPLAQFEADLWIEHAAMQAETFQAETKEAEKMLRNAWKGDAYEKNTANVSRLLKAEFGLTDEDFKKPIGNCPALIRALREKVMPALGEDKIIEGTMIHSMESAETRMKQINLEMHKAQPGTPEYKKLIDEKTELMKRIQ